MFFRKFIVTVLLALAIGIAFANGKFTATEISAISNITSSSSEVMECRAKILEYVTLTDIPEWQKKSIEISWFSALQTDWIPWRSFKPNKYSDIEISEIDSTFGKAGIRFQIDYLPMCFTNAVVSAWPSNSVQRSICYKYGRTSLLGYLGNWKKTIYDIEDIVYVFSTELVSKKDSTLLDGAKRWQKMMTDSYLKTVKKYLRANGKSILVTDGVNPLASYMDAFSTALNAPRFDGLDACFASIGKPELKLDLSDVRSAEWAETFKAKVLDDEADLNNPVDRFNLLINLGTENYNRLVQQYNGGN